MSIFSSWSYNSTATLWAPTLDEFSEATAWTRSTISCSYMAGGRQMLSSQGEEFVPATMYYFESSDAAAPAPGWMIIVGDIAGASPTAAAETIRSVRRGDPATFNEGLPDYIVGTS